MTFGGATVALLESRLSDEIASLVRRHGGIPYSAPAVTEVPVGPDPSLRDLLVRIGAGDFDIIVLLTGQGATRLFEEAERAGTTSSVETAVRRATTVCRGPKPALVLKKRGLVARYLVSAPHTTDRLLETLADLPLNGRRALIISAGETLAEPATFIAAHGGRTTEALLYRWDLSPEVRVALLGAVVDLIDGRIDALAITTQVQVRHLMSVAIDHGLDERLRIALRDRVIVGAVGPTCAHALRAHGIQPHVVPDHPKMGHLVLALAEAIERRGHLRDGV
jgi:uroporphyrinogen-III synthase